jgi:hypothetical protein
VINLKAFGRKQTGLIDVLSHHLPRGSGENNKTSFTPSTNSDQALPDIIATPACLVVSLRYPKLQLSTDFGETSHFQAS